MTLSIWCKEAQNALLELNNFTPNDYHICTILPCILLQEEKVRRRHDWMKYITPSSRVLTESGLPSPSGSGYGAFTTSFQKITLEEEDKVNPHSEDLQFSESAGQSKLCNGDGTEFTLSNHS